MTGAIRCLTCGESFETLEAYDRHRWGDHAGDVDHGTAFYGGTGRIELESLIPEDRCPDPPLLGR